MNRIIALSLLSLSVVSTAAFADDVTGFRTGVDLSLGQSSSTGTAARLDSSLNYGLHLRGGYDINKYLAIEASYGGVTGPKSNGISVSTSAMTVDVLGFYPLQDDGISVYGLVGYGKLNTTASLAGLSSTRGQTGLKIGAGIELGRGQKSGLRLGIESYDTGYTRTTSIMVGPVWKF